MASTGRTAQSSSSAASGARAEMRLLAQAAAGRLLASGCSGLAAQQQAVPGPCLMPRRSLPRRLPTTHACNALSPPPARPPEGRRYRPYDLLVVPREAAARAAEYFTVSANGVVAIRGGQQAEFVALSSWVRQRSLFDLVSQIGFYKHFLTGRAFRRWHKVRSAGDCAARAAAAWRPACVRQSAVMRHAHSARA